VLLVAAVLPLRLLAGDPDAIGTAVTVVGEGSTTTPRSVTDTAYGELNIYVGGSLPVGANIVSLRFLFDRTTAGNMTGYITPLLFEFNPVEAFTVYTVVGIGQGFKVNLNAAAQSVPVHIIEGIKVPPAGNFTFGFVNSILNLSGIPLLTSEGVVDFDGTYPDGGQGVGGAGTTNDWLWTAESTPPIVALGKTFALSGGTADYTLGLPYRTYSAHVIGFIP